MASITKMKTLASTKRNKLSRSGLLPQRLPAYVAGRLFNLTEGTESEIYMEAYHSRKKWYRRANRHKMHANLLVFRTIKRGKLTRPSNCSECNKKCKALAHHEDYSKPLEVIWLCSKCHKSKHLVRI